MLDGAHGWPAADRRHPGHRQRVPAPALDLVCLGLVLILVACWATLLCAAGERLARALL